MRRVLLGIGILFLILGSIYLLHPQVANPPKPSSPTPTQLYCNAKDLSTTISFEGAAGSTYTTAKLVNNTDHECILHGNLFIDPTYNSSVTNFTVVHNTPQPPPVLVLPAHGVANAIIHYNNGPQCSSEVKQSTVQFTYTLANNERVVFMDNAGKNNFHISTCADSSEISTIDITAFSLVR